jgi:outer membrane protein OmpA-like peptidoglycan-associated protein
MRANFSLSVAVAALLTVGGCSSKTEEVAEEQVSQEVTSVKVSQIDVESEKVLNKIRDYSFEKLGDTENSETIANTIADELDSDVRENVKVFIKDGELDRIDSVDADSELNEDYIAENVFADMQPQVDDKLSPYLGEEEVVVEEAILDEEIVDEAVTEEVIEPEPVQLPVDAVASINSSSIVSGSADITDEMKENLDAIASFLIENPSFIAVVNSYTDSTGSDAVNLQLSQERADNVAEYLVSKGAAIYQAIADGYGEADLKYPEDPTSPENRRYEIKLVENAE